MIPLTTGSYDGPMADRDPAFLWETEALRSAAPLPGKHRRPASSEQPPQELGDDWLTLREASAKTGVPVATLRKWALKDKIPTLLEDRSAGARRLVSLEGVQERAVELGRDLEPSAPPAAGRSETPVSKTPPPSEETPPAGTMIVPIEAWDKMLIQLGNLHEAGQQLAEARERAARAETEATFLRERLAEIRAAREGSRSDPAPDEPAGQPERMPSLTVYLWKSAVSGLRRKR